MSDITLDRPLTFQEVAAIAGGARLTLSAGARERIAAARRIVDAIVEKGIRAYGVNTGVGALSDVVVDRAHQRDLSRKLLMSHAVGVGAPLPVEETRAIIAAAICNYANARSGVRLALVEGLAGLLNADCIPIVPARGSVGYLSHMAQIGLVLVGAGEAMFAGERLAGSEALRRAGLTPLVLEAKEGLSIVNGTPCATGLAALALARAARVLDWADAVAALTFEGLGGQIAAFAEESLGQHRSPGLNATGARLRSLLDGSARLAASAGRRTQDALSIRAIPQVHGAARDAFAYAAGVTDRELASASDNPVVLGTPEEPRVYSEAHAVGASIGMAMDMLGIAMAEIGGMSERRLDRLVNPLVSGLPAFLAEDSGVSSGFMIAQYTAVALVGENRRLAAPASVDGGVTSGLQEDHLAHATPASMKALAIIDNAVLLLGIELLAAAQACEFLPKAETLGRGTAGLHARMRSLVAPYADDRPLGLDLAKAAALIRQNACPV